MKNKIYPMRLDPADREIFERLGTRLMMPTARLVKGVVRQLFDISEALKEQGNPLPFGQVPKICVDGVVAPFGLIDWVKQGGLVNQEVEVEGKKYLVDLTIKEAPSRVANQRELPKGNSHEWKANEEGNLVAVPLPSVSDSVDAYFKRQEDRGVNLLEDPTRTVRVKCPDDSNQ